MADRAGESAPGLVASYRIVLGSRLRAQVQYRASFALDVLTSALTFLGGFVEVAAVFTNVHRLGDLDLRAALLVYGVAALGFGLANTVAGNLDKIPTYIRAGTLETMLTRPQPVLAQILTSDLTLRRVGTALVGLGVLAAGLASQPVAWTPAKVALIAIAPLSAGLLFGRARGPGVGGSRRRGRGVPGRPAALAARDAPLHGSGRVTAAEAVEAAVRAEGLTRTFVRRGGRLRRTRTAVHAVERVSFAIAPGETVGYIGANGAGKSTTIKMITGILVPSEGTVRTFGREPVAHRTEIARRLGVVFGQRSQLWWDLPLRESLRLLAAIHRLPPARWRPREASLVERLELGEFLGRPVRQLSLGQRMRGEVAAALLHAPELVVLDEPTVGLDVLSKERLRTFLREDVAARGTTLLLATHDMDDMDDVQRLCARLLVVDGGRLVYDGDIPGLVARVGARRVLVVDLEAPAGALDAVPGTELVGIEADGVRQRLAFSPGTTTAAAVLAEVSRVAAVRDLSIEEPDIEDVVRRLYLSSGR